MPVAAPATNEQAHAVAVLVLVPVAVVPEERVVSLGFVVVPQETRQLHPVGATIAACPAASRSRPEVPEGAE